MGIFEEVIAQSSRRPEGLPGVLERRRVKRPSMMRSSHTSLASHLWELEFVPPFGLTRLAGDIEELSRRSLDTNIFFNADVVCSAWPRLTSQLAPKGCWMLCLWENIGDTRYLRVFMPVRLASVGFPGRKVLQPLSNEFMPIGTPLLDAECAGEATETFLRLLADPALNLPAVIDFTHQVTGRATFDAIKSAAVSLGLDHAETLTHERAAIVSNEERREGYPGNVLKKKSLDEYQRLLRRLGETGDIAFSTASKPDDVLDAFEAFLTLELKGWKGRRGTALYNQKKIAAFSRQIIVELAARNRCEIHSLKRDGKLVSALILFHRDGHVVPWKTSFDERLSRYSPGVQIMLHATRKLLDRKTFICADSLAHEHHWMINRLWPDRIKITDLAVQVTPFGKPDLASVIASKERAEDWKTRAKALLRGS